MNNLAILPIVIPLLTGIALVFIREKLSIVRRATQLMALVNLLVVAATAIYIYRFGPIILELETGPRLSGLSSWRTRFRSRSLRQQTLLLCPVPFTLREPFTKNGKNIIFIRFFKS